MNKKLISGLVSGILVLSFFVFPGRGLAETVSPALQSQIQALLVIIQQLQAQLAELQAAQTSAGQSQVSTQSPGSSDSVPLVNPPNSQPNNIIKEKRGFSVGDKVRASEKLRVRVSPGSEIVATLLGGDTGTIIDASRWSGSYWWVNVKWDKGFSGWSAEDWLTKVGSGQTYACGDINADGLINASDTKMYQDYIFSGGTVPAGVKTDLNGDGGSDILDLTILIDNVNSGGPAPTCVAPQRMPYVPPTTNPTINPNQQPQGVSSVPLIIPVCGDVNADGAINQLDVTALVNHIFSGASVPAGVSPDLNGDGVADVFDQVALSDYLAGKAPAPTCKAISNGGYKPPTMKSFTGPSTLIVGQSGNWYVNSVIGEGGANHNMYYKFNWGDGIANPPLNQLPTITGTSGVTASASKTYSQAGSYNVTVWFSDGSEAFYSKTLPVVVGNTSPKTYTCGDINADGAINQLDVTALVNHIFSGASVPAGVSPDLNGDGVADVFDQVALSDYLAGKAPAPTCAAAPTNQPPMISGVTGPTALAVGQSGTWPVLASDPNSDLLYYSVTWGDGGENAPQTGSTFLHTYGAAGTYPARFTVNDGKGGVTKSDVTITVSGPTVSNQPPVISSVSGPTSIVTQQSGTWTVSASDPNSDVLYYTVTWGDGGSNTFQIGSSFAHTYWAAGTYPARFTVSDEKGGVTKSDVVVTVSVPTISLACGDINADGAINAADVTTYQNYIFSGGTVPAGVKTDLNGDGGSDILDLTMLIDRVQNGGPAPTCVAPQPFPVVPPVTNLPRGASVLSSIGSQLNGISVLLNQIIGQLRQ